jgi:hypothetical protein
MANRGSNPFLLPMVVVGGIMGLLAAYGALVILRDHGLTALQPAKPIAESHTSNTGPTTTSPSIPKPAKNPIAEVPDPPIRSPRRRQTESPAANLSTDQSSAPIRHIDIPYADSDKAPAAEGTPADDAPVKPPKIAAGPTQRLVLQLTDRVHREPVSLKGPLLVKTIEGAEYSMKPEDGSLSSTVEISINGGPRPVTLKVSVVSRGEGRQCLLEPTIGTDDGRAVPFTMPNLDSIVKRLNKSDQQAASALQSLQAERARVKAWIDSPTTKALTAYKAASARVKELDVPIPEAQTTATDFDAQLLTARSVVEFAKRLDGHCKIDIEPVAAAN